MVGIYLVEYGRGRFARAATFFVDVMTGVPSIVAGLFVYTVFVTTFHGRGPAGWSLALAMLMIPVVVRTSEEMLKLVPRDLREASYALGRAEVADHRRSWLPTAMSGLITGVVLGIARVAGETAPLLLLVGYTPASTSTRSPDPWPLPGWSGTSSATSGDARRWTCTGTSSPVRRADRVGCGATLILIVMALNLLARLIGQFTQDHPSH